MCIQLKKGALVIDHVLQPPLEYVGDVRKREPLIVGVAHDQKSAAAS